MDTSETCIISWVMDLALKCFMAIDRYLLLSIGKTTNMALVLLSEIDLVVHTRFQRIKIICQGFWRMKPDLYCYFFFYLPRMFIASKSLWKGPRDDVWRPAWVKESQNKEAVLILYYSLYKDEILFWVEAMTIEFISVLRRGRVRIHYC